MKTMDFDRIGSSVPINADAGKAVSQRGIHFEPDKKITQLRWDAPPPMRAIPENGLAAIGDLPGKKIGRFTVLGLLAAHNSNEMAKWVVRCVCGAYETRRTKALRNPANVNDSCQHCRHLVYIKERYARLGAGPIVRAPVPVSPDEQRGA